jgi:hypothetical protein
MCHEEVDKFIEVATTYKAHFWTTAKSCHGLAFSGDINSIFFRKFGTKKAPIFSPKVQVHFLPVFEQFENLLDQDSGIQATTLRTSLP